MKSVFCNIVLKYLKLRNISVLLKFYKMYFIKYILPVLDYISVLYSPSQRMWIVRKNTKNFYS